jgi:hypothetical protein
MSLRRSFAFLKDLCIYKKTKPESQQHPENETFLAVQKPQPERVRVEKIKQTAAQTAEADCRAFSSTACVLSVSSELKESTMVAGCVQYPTCSAMLHSRGQTQ